MKKYFTILSLCILVAAACTKTPFEGPGATRNTEETGMVAVTMELQVPVTLQASTKGDQAHDPDIDYIKVAMFGTSLTPQAYTLAEPVGSYATTNDIIYKFKVLLPVYEGEAHVHIIANGDEEITFVEQKEDDIMKMMNTTDGAGAYWARVVLPEGILPQKDVNGIMQTDNQGNFIPSTETARYFKNLQLIRNFAEVTLILNTDDITDVSWTLMNVPVRGSVAPMAGGTYVDDFKDYTYYALDADHTDRTKAGRMVSPEGKVYNGFMFDDYTFAEDEKAMNYEIPEYSASTWTSVTKAMGDKGSSRFVYERPHPGSNKATAIMMKATYRGTVGYYRIDLMDEAAGGYFPLYRNYQYKVRIDMVGNPGAATPTLAAERDSGGNVSMTSEAKSLTDVSDGVGRLEVEYIEKSFTKGGKHSIWVRYTPDVTVQNPVVDNSLISWDIKTQGGALKKGTSLTLKPGSTQTGKYIYEFVLNEQDEDEDLESVIEFRATNATKHSTLYREVTLRVVKKMDMTLGLSTNPVSGANATTNLLITLPDDLPSSVFPLDFYIEDVNHTLNPTYKKSSSGTAGEITVPVKVGPSLADGLSDSFYFIRTVQEAEYNASHVISTEFKVLQAASATTLYVTNEYFKTQHINLLNSGLYVNPIHATVEFFTRSLEVEVETAGAAWSVTGEGDVTVAKAADNKSFTMSFPANTDPAHSVKRIASVTSGGVTQTVTITQEALDFSVIADPDEVAFNASSATVTVYAANGVSWTASVTGGATLSAASGTGTQTLTLNFDPNDTEAQKIYTLTATASGTPASATVTQGRGPDPDYTFVVDDFTFKSADRTGKGLSFDDYIRVSMTNIGNADGEGNFKNPKEDGFIQLGERLNGTTVNQGTITVTPEPGLKIKGITVTYVDSDNAGYDFGNTSVSVSAGTYTRDGAVGTWTGNSTEAVTFTNGYNLNVGAYSFPRISSIKVTYEPAN